MKMIVPELVEKFPALYNTPKFITVLRGGPLRHITLSRAS